MTCRVEGGRVGRLSGGEPSKVDIARVIWEKTSVNLNWIAENLAMKSAANASQQIRRSRYQEPRLPKAVNKWIALMKNAA